MTGRLTAGLLLAALCAGSHAAQTPANSPPTAARAGIAASAFMAGHWIGDIQGNLSEEIWTEPAEGSMLGMWRLIVKGQPRVIELLAIAQVGEGLVMRLRHFDGRLVAREEKDRPIELHLTRVVDGEVVFEGASADGSPVRLEYRRDGPDGLAAALVRGAERDEFRYRRRAAAQR